MRIGFAKNKSDGGPAGFLRKLRLSLENIHNTRTSLFIDPRVDCNIFSNKVYRFWNKSYIYRVDGIYMDIVQGRHILDQKNAQIGREIADSIGVVFQTEYCRQVVERIIGVKADRWVTIINGTDLQLFNGDGPDRRKELGIPNDAFVFITSAKWRAHKRLGDILKAFKMFNHEYPNSYLVVIGDNDLIEEHAKIKFISTVPNYELPSYLRSGDSYIFLSWLEPCANSVVEAIACGLPVICSNQGGTKEILELTNGGIVVEGDEDFEYQYIDLYNPPEVNTRLVVEGMSELYTNYNFYKDRINVIEIDINNVSKKYLNFIKESVYDKKSRF